MKNYYNLLNIILISTYIMLSYQFYIYILIKINRDELIEPSLWLKTILIFHIFILAFMTDNKLDT